MRKSTAEGSRQLGLFTLPINEGDATDPVGRSKNKRTIMFRDLCELINSDYAVKGRRSRAALSVRFQHLRPFFGSFKATEITRDLIERYCDSRLGEFHGKLQKSTSPNSVRLELKCLRRMFKLAVDRRMLSRIPVFPALKKPSQSRRRDFIDQWTFETIRAGMPPDLADALTFLYVSAWRPGELYALRWRDVKLNERLIEFRSEDSRNEEPHRLPFDDPAELNAVMIRARATRRFDCPFVFHRDGHRLTAAMFRKPWAIATKAAAAEGFVVFDLRRSSERNLVLSGVDERTAKSISGRRTDSAFARGEIEVDDLRAAMAKLGAFLDARRMKSGKIIPIRAARFA